MRLLSLLVLLGCGPKKKTEAAADDPPAREAREEGVVEGGVARTPAPEWMQRVPPAGSEVNLLEAGAEPRQVLRLHPQAGQATTLRLVMDMDMSMQMQGMSMPAMDIPPIYMDIQNTVTEVREDGAFRTEVIFQDAGVEESADVDPALKEVFTQAFAMVEGLRGTSLTDPSGRILEMNFAVPADPMLQQQLTQMNQSANSLSAPFPDQPVGVGARWEVLMKQEANGMPIYQQAIFELTGVSENRAHLSADIDQYIAPDATIPGLPPDANVEFVAFDSEGGGQIVMDLARGTPADAAMDIRTAMQMNVSMGTGSQRMGMDMNIKLRMAPR